MNTVSPRRRRADDLISEVDHIGDREHFVHFYAHDDQLAEGVARYLAVGFAQGDLGLAIGTAAHIKLIEGALAGLGLDAKALARSGQYSSFDAEEMLNDFMVDGELEPGRFKAGVIGAWLRAAAHSGRGVRAFGEMVACLWAQGKAEQAIELERLWNELGQMNEFALYCAYPTSITDDASSDSFVHICREHSRIIRSGTRGEAFA